MSRRLLLLLGDQLDLSHPALQQLDRQRDHILLAELHQEASYVPHNKLKIALIFSAMRHFAAELREQGFYLYYYDYVETKDNWASFSQLLNHQLNLHDYAQLWLIEPGEYRLQAQYKHWQGNLPLPVQQFPSHNFIFSRTQMHQWFAAHPQPRMEHFYQWARQQTGLLMESGRPIGGKYNFDKQNRRPWSPTEQVPTPRAFRSDKLTQEVLHLVSQEFSDNPGKLEHFNYAVCREQALLALDDFIQNRLAKFGDYQDALADNQPAVFHSLLSVYINLGLLSPLDVCQQAQQAYQQGHAPLNAVEGFIRQILGWREYVRGLYWFMGEDYAQGNYLQAERALPDWFWHAKVQMRCMQQAIGNSLHRAYAHHIQRLMVIGNFCLLAGLDVRSVCTWYLAVYVDAFEWVELPNTLGMALYADGGILASKPYAASGNYLHKMGNHCQHCPYSPKQTTGLRACPYNALYWQFIDTHQQAFAAHPRMALMVAQWQKKSHSEQNAIRDWAGKLLTNLDRL
ncbi:cryptochrome/photolyase family protein [Bowmanella pacifica]|uniref:(6-4) photolyase n=3 Tax=Bowmanella TaxID=366580 RepID=A0A918DFG1_9ALTE|nr:cryptochrome/photolyase family protein [Bowmanella pacifica]GGO63863.1 (6-4) photolyase [Bowmanella pacifica]